MTTLASLCRHPVRTALPGNSIHEAAELMREHHVGALVVLDQPEPAGRPVGIVTDRDIVVTVVALGLDPDIFLLDDLLDRPLTVARDDLHLREGLELMRSNGVRRLPLVDRHGALTGIVALDDLARELARDMDRVADVIEGEIRTEAAARRCAGQRPPRTRKRGARGNATGAV